MSGDVISYKNTLFKNFAAKEKTKTFLIILLIKCSPPVKSVYLFKLPRTDKKRQTSYKAVRGLALKTKLPNSVYIMVIQ